jgi:hypothetical protein
MVHGADGDGCCDKDLYYLVVMLLGIGASKIAAATTRIGGSVHR